MRKSVHGALIIAAVCSLSLRLGANASTDTIPSNAGTRSFMAAAVKSKALAAPPPCSAMLADSPESNGIYKIGKATGVTPPRAIHQVNAEPSDRARRAVHNGETSETKFTSVIRFVVDKDGLPSDLCVQKSAPFDLDAEAAKAVRQFRFEPAMKDGAPVRVRINIELNFEFK